MKKEIEFVTTDIYPLENLQRVQKRLYEIACTAIDILERHKVPYFIAFGTLLGAVRHEGFIPWDDDFDIFIFEEDYDTALEYLRNELPNDIVVHDQLNDHTYYAAWSKLRDVNSITHCEKYLDENEHIYRGVNVDLYKLKKVNRNEIDVHWNREHMEFLVRKHDAGFFTKKEYAEVLEKQAKEYIESVKIAEKNRANIDQNDELFAFVVFFKSMELSTILPLRQYKFENRMFWGPNDADQFLSKVYGNYMEFPAYKDRKPHCDYVEFLD